MEANNLIAHNLSKISLLETYDAIYRHNFLCISDAYLDSSALERNIIMLLVGYNMIRAGFIKSTDHLPTDHQPKDHQPLIHRPTDAVIMSKRLENSSIFTLQKTNTAGKM